MNDPKRPGYQTKEMRWTKMPQLPCEKGFYVCYLPKSESCTEHIKEYWFDGEFFRDGNSWMFLLGEEKKHGRKINKYIDSWLKITKP